VSDLTQLIRAALDCGVQLRLVDGRIKVSGKRAALDAWAPRLRPHRAQLIEALQPPGAVDWRPLAAAYHRHHFTCPTCIASGKGAGLRCGLGSVLWASYQHCNQTYRDKP
jgi:hypothetical protein